MELRLYDTLSREKRTFVPLDAEDVRMYVCGPTVYDFAHIGNARPVIVFDVLFRLLRHLYGAAHVKYVRNITDVDDKINDRAARDFPGLPLNEAIRKVTEQTGKQFHADVDALGALRPSVEPRATDHIGEMREIIERLVKGGFAYPAEDHVLFSPQAMNAASSGLPRYGALSNRSLDEMVAGARVDVAPYKKGNTDFVLWKPSKPGEPSWPSPAGIAAQGRPGWHIECSAMAWKHLGEQFDIHGGGIDLVFPHHENEVAQTCCAFHQQRMANYWMHNGFLQVESEKMSKSLGNFITIRELLESDKFGGRKWSGEVLRFAMLQTHYRQPIDWTVSSLDQALSRLESWKGFAAERVESRQNKGLFDDVVGLLCDDLNTPGALGLVDRVVNSIGANDRDRYTVGKILHLLGFKRPHSEVFKLSRNVILAARGLAKLTSNEWNALVNAVQRQPTAASGEPRPATELIAATSVLTELVSKLSAKWSPAEAVVSQFKSGVLAKAAPKQTKREKLIDKLIAARLAAREQRNWGESDRIRNELAAMGIVLKDAKDADGNPITTWEVAR
ncbi:cysteine--tRNA ligase [Bradyrhizobium sp. 40]|nr:cysteine--tRNA ligase [Bradyrhizobium sp. 40]UPJ39938.1 cysteine--tRNA ligase [Bradyrhizobium sp. 40]